MRKILTGAKLLLMRIYNHEAYLYVYLFYLRHSEVNSMTVEIRDACILHCLLNIKVLVVFVFYLYCWNCFVLRVCL